MNQLLTREEIERAVEAGSVEGWKRRRYETFDETMTDGEPPYPCYFAVEAHEDGDTRYLFPGPPDREESREAVAAGLESYLNRLDSLPPITALVVLFEPPETERGAEWYEEAFWSVVEYLDRNDPEPWPESIPADPADPRWAFCFAGEPVFLVARAPFYEARRSRRTEHGLEITVQPRSAFEGLESDTERGRQARKTIRGRLEKYDDAPRHPAIGDYGDPDTREWKQYFLPDDDEVRAEFPFTPRATE